MKAKQCFSLCHTAAPACNFPGEREAAYYPICFPFILRKDSALLSNRPIPSAVPSWCSPPRPLAAAPPHTAPAWGSPATRRGYTQPSPPPPSSQYPETPPRTGHRPLFPHRRLPRPVPAPLPASAQLGACAAGGWRGGHVGGFAPVAGEGEWEGVAVAAAFVCEQAVISFSKLGGLGLNRVPRLRRSSLLCCLGGKSTCVLTAFCFPPGWRCRAEPEAAAAQPGQLPRWAAGSEHRRGLHGEGTAVPQSEALAGLYGKAVSNRAGAGENGAIWRCCPAR